ncbi:MAG: hypothetical protein M5U07_22365 [Xanthobacteraceae bacterium]|nr:hypothetical protein [Xanthobacteraceae bacterium]GIL00581.1 MAG: hypothetical protein BroJett030_04800 [Alphaproteobacteria bacterium]
MDVALRLILRFILVPLGYLAAVLAGAGVILFGVWRLGEIAADLPQAAGLGLFAFSVVLLIGVMWLPLTIGILISEAFAIRSWIFHALNGAASAWIGFQLSGRFEVTGLPVQDALPVLAAGLAAGFAYWLVAGASAGFWKPVFGSTAGGS